MDVLTALTYACSQNPVELKAGEQQLKAWEKERGYYAGLASVFGNRSIDSNVRWMAITCLKNGIDCYWRHTAPHAISDEEKIIIRKVLLECIEEPEQKIVLQLAVLIGKIARIDCPHQWPEVLTVLTEKVRSDSPLIQKCSLLILREVIKAFSSWRILNHRLVFYEITNTLFAYITRVWVSHLTSVSGYIARGQLDSATDSLTMASICLKILQSMLLYGFARFNVSTDAISLVMHLFELAPEALKLRSQLPISHPSHEIAEQTSTLIIKTIFKLQRSHPMGFISFINHSLLLVFNTIFNPEIRNQMYEGFLVYGFNLMKSIVKCEDYATPLSGGINEVTVPTQVFEAQQMKNDFFLKERLETVLNQLITHYMILTPEDLEKWQDSPEDMLVCDDVPGQTYMFSLKSSMEGLLIAIVNDMTNTAAPILIEMLSAVQNTDASAEWSALLVKEAVYNAVGVVAFDLYQHLNFELWFENHLVNELQITDPTYRIIRRRVVWLLGCWVGVKFDPVYRPSLYRCLLPTLSPSEDIVVRLTAVDALKQAIDDIGFSSEDFSPFIPNATELLLQLLNELQNSETKLSVMNVFSLLIERIGSSVQPYIGSLIEQIPRIWSETQGDNASMLHCVIISMLSHLVKSLGALSVQLHPFLVHIIRQATDIKQKEHLYLAEDGLELWTQVLHHTPQPSIELLLLLLNMNGLLGLTTPTDDSTQSMEGLMDIGSSSLMICFNVIDAYVVLCHQSPDLFLQHCSEVVTKSCQTYIRDVKQTGVEAIVNVLDRVMVAFPVQSHQTLQPVLLQLLHCVLSGQETYAPTLCLYLAVLARAILCNAQHFIIILQLLVPELQQEVNVLLGMLLDVWAYRLDNIGELKRRKLFGLAAASLLTVNDICVLGRFGSLLDMCVDVLHDVTDTSTSGGQVDTLVVKGFDSTMASDSLKPHPTDDTEHNKRIRQLNSQDPVWSVPLPQLVAQQLEICLTTLGIDQYRALMSNIDIVIREQLADFLTPDRMKILLVIDS